VTRMDPRMAARRKAVQETQARRSLRRLTRLLFVAALLAAVVWLFRSPFLSVHDVEVAGGREVDVAGTLAASGIEAGVPMMDVDTEAAETALGEDPWVASVSVARRWPQTVVVEIEERRPVAWVLDAGGWWATAADGVRLEPATSPEPGWPVVVVPALEGEPTPELVGVLEFVASLPPELSESAEVRHVGDMFSARVSGFEVRLGSGENGREKALAVAALIATEPAPGSVLTVMAPGQPAVLPPDEQSTSDETIPEP